MTNRPRNRVVLFRLSQDEYRALKETCERRGGRNVSEFTRSEVLDFLSSSVRPDRVADLAEQVAGLRAIIEDLDRFLKGTAPC
jgi:hypothetical protein